MSTSVDILNQFKKPPSFVQIPHWNVFWYWNMISRVQENKSIMLTCRNSSFPSLWEHWKFVPTWRKSRTRAVYLFMWYITSYIWYIGPVHCLEKQGEMILSQNTIGRMIGKIFNYSLGQTHRKDHSSGKPGNSLDSTLFLGLVLQQEQLPWKGLSVGIARMEEQEERWPGTMDINALVIQSVFQHSFAWSVAFKKTGQ